jgi:hypothetical protein
VPATEETVGALISSAGVILFWIALLIFLLHQFVLVVRTNIKKWLFYFLLFISRDFLVRYRPVRKLLTDDWSLWVTLGHECIWIPGPQEDVPVDSIPFLMMIENKDRFRIIRWFRRPVFSGTILRDEIYKIYCTIRFQPLRLPTATVVQEKSCRQKTR